jgi:hypothetical protein
VSTDRQLPYRRRLELRRVAAQLCIQKYDELLHARRTGDISLRVGRRSLDAARLEQGPANHLLDCGNRLSITHKLNIARDFL